MTLSSPFRDCREPSQLGVRPNKLLAQAAERGGLWGDLARIEIMKALLGPTTFGKVKI